MAKNLIEFRLNRNGDADALNFNGEVAELLAGTLTMIRFMYHHIYLNGSKADAEWFHENMGRAMVCPDHPLYKEVWE